MCLHKQKAGKQDSSDSEDSDTETVKKGIVKARNELDLKDLPEPEAMDMLSQRLLSLSVKSIQKRLNERLFSLSLGRASLSNLLNSCLPLLIG